MKQKTGKTKIAFIGIKGLPANAGADRVVEAIVTRLNKQHYEVTAYCSNQHVPKGTTFNDVELLRIPTLKSKYLHSTLLFLLSALHALFLRDYDLIHIHNVEASFVLPLLRPRYRIIVTSHGLAQKRDKWNRVSKALLRITEYPFMYLSHCATCVSLPLTKYYETIYKKEIHYVPNGVELNGQVDEVRVCTILAEQSLQPGRYILFAAGRILQTKGCHTLLEAYQAMSTDIPLLIVGDDTQNPAYSRELRNLADERVRFVPFIASKEVLAGIVKNAHLFVFPSIIEAMSMMLLEVAALVLQRRFENPSKQQRKTVLNEETNTHYGA
jgi:glycosyltransferase involved in cell wall biosynthesis